jgi:SAM-dependent methyltransferase
MSEPAENAYVLGTSDEELIRLGLQHQLWSAQASEGWERANFKRGDLLLDLGCGPGYATFELAQRVGADGFVTAIDQSHRFIHYLEQQKIARGVSNIATRLAALQSSDLGENQFDGAYARWVFCFLASPGDVLENTARALKPGGALLVQDYFYYEGVRIAPTSPIFEKFFKAVAQSWRTRGGDPDIGSKLPGMLRERGLEIESIRPICRIARPDTALWSWPDSFFGNYLPTLVELKLITTGDKADFESEWQNRSQYPDALFFTPPMVEIVARKPAAAGSTKA